MELRVQLVHAEGQARVVLVSAYAGERLLGSALGEAADAEAAEERALMRLMARLEGDWSASTGSGPGSSDGLSSAVPGGGASAKASPGPAAGPTADVVAHAVSASATNPPSGPMPDAVAPAGAVAATQRGRPGSPPPPAHRLVDPEAGGATKRSLRAPAPSQVGSPEVGGGAAIPNGSARDSLAGAPSASRPDWRSDSPADSPNASPKESPNTSYGDSRRASSGQSPSSSTNELRSPSPPDAPGDSPSDSAEGSPSASAGSSSAPLAAAPIAAAPIAPSSAAASNLLETPAEHSLEPPADPEDWSSELLQLDRELERLQWGRAEEEVYLRRAYGHPSRNRLTSYADLLAYLRVVEALQAPADPASAAVPLRRQDLLGQCDALLRQLGWPTERARQFLESQLKVSSRQQLSDQDLLQFNLLLEGEVLAAG